MRKIIIKLPNTKVAKFRLQREGWKSKRFLRAATLLNRLKTALLPYKLTEKTAIVVKESNGKSFKNINESLASDDPKYLVYTASCFLEDSLQQEILNKYK